MQSLKKNKLSKGTIRCTWQLPSISLSGHCLRLIYSIKIRPRQKKGSGQLRTINYDQPEKKLYSISHLLRRWPHVSYITFSQNNKGIVFQAVGNNEAPFTSLLATSLPPVDSFSVFFFFFFVGGDTDRRYNLLRSFERHLEHYFDCSASAPSASGRDRRRCHTSCGSRNRTGRTAQYG